MEDNYNNKDNTFQTTIPTKIIRGMEVLYCGKKESIDFPLSTYETPLFASVSRGVKITKLCTISVAVLSSNMTRSIVFECNNVFEIQKLIETLKHEQNINHFINFQHVINKTSKHCRIEDIQFFVVGRLFYVRFSFETSEASGHNMTTIASNELAKYIVEIAKLNKIYIKYLSNSANLCVDKKVSAINSICGRGKKVVAEITISKKICEDILHTTPEKIAELNIDKNFIGSILSGSTCSANAHYANMLAGIFLPLGQDIANIVEGSQGITFCKVNADGSLYFSVNLPNVICGVIGNGKDIDFVKENLKLIGCIDVDGNPTNNASERMASIIACAVLCGELSLMSALTNEDELVKSHLLLERNYKNINK